jgi:hypothetical protein
LILVSDNISENQGGDLVEQCRMRNVKQLFTCPYHPQQNFAENYIGRITTMASFGMVYSGAPMFMWIWAVKTAVFIDHIMASFYSKQKVWATPYELVHGELFPDASVIVPFGCGVLVLLTEKERSKFKSRCALMLFVHYADSHPLYTYAVYSPRTRKVLMRQDCIFPTKLFPMRVARVATGMGPNGEAFHPVRAPMGNLCGDQELSFANWVPTDPLPQYDDHVTHWKLDRPDDSELLSASDQKGNSDPASISGGSVHYPSHPGFGAPSSVAVNTPQGFRSDESRFPGDAPRPPVSVPLGPRGERFSIWLVYPGTLREPHLHGVYASMTVRYLYESVAGILQYDPVDFHLLVQREHLWHSGRITNRQDPITMQPTCFLVSRSVVTVCMVSTFPHLIQPDATGPTRDYEVGDSNADGHADDDGGDVMLSIDRNPADPFSLANAQNDPELAALYHQLAELHDQILARWVVLLSFAPPHAPSRRDDFDDDDELDDSHSGGGSSFSNQGTSTRGAPAPAITSTQPSSSHQLDNSQVDSALLPLSSTIGAHRRVSTRQPAPRIPYVSGSGEGLASKDHERNLVRRPANQRWFYDSTSASVPTLAVEPPRPLNCSDSAAHHACWQILNPPDSDESEDSELNDAELVDAIIESTCINTVNDWGEPAIARMVSLPGFTILRTGSDIGTALVMFPDRSFRVYFIDDVDEAFRRLWVAGGQSIPPTVIHGQSTQGASTSHSHLAGLTTGEFTSDKTRAVLLSESVDRRDVQPTDSGCAHPESSIFDQTIFDSFPEPVFTQELQFSDSDWRFLDRHDPFTINLHFPNALDPDNPSAKLSNISLEVFGNQTVPNLYLQIASITGVFPQSIRLRILDKVLCHRGVISTDRYTGADGIVLGKCPPVTKDCVVVVMMLCEEGLKIPQGLDGYPVGFPASLPPDGATRFTWEMTN